MLSPDPPVRVVSTSAPSLSPSAPAAPSVSKVFAPSQARLEPSLSERRRVVEATEALAAAYRRGEASPFQTLERLWSDHGGGLTTLSALVKTELACRRAAGEDAAAAEYLDRFPALRGDDDRALSVIYEEYCLRFEAGEAVDQAAFCARYAPWKDSLEMQLVFHDELSRFAELPSAAPPKFPEPGGRFLRFRLNRVLGRGGSSQVYLVDDEGLGGRRAALKISQDRGEEPSIMGRLDHRHIMPVWSVDRDPETGLRGLCMPFRPGRTLNEVIDRMAGIPPAQRNAATFLRAAEPETLDTPRGGPGWEGFPNRGSYADACAWIGARLAEALAHSHQRQTQHRDVKPANILIAASEGPQLFDFNLAESLAATDRVASALRGGTLPYMAPEQLRAFQDPNLWSNVGPSADLYALGLVLIELATGERPEAPSNATPLPRALNELVDLRRAGPPEIHARNPAIPHGLEAILQRVAAPEAADRYPDAAALAEDLRRFLARRPLKYVENPSVRERCVGWTIRNRPGLGLLAVGLATVLIAGAAQDPDRTVTEATFLLDKVKRNFSEDQKRVFLEDAERGFRQALRLDPKNPRAYHGLAKIAEERGQFEVARQYLDRAIALARRELEATRSPPSSAAEEKRAALASRREAAGLMLHKLYQHRGQLASKLRDLDPETARRQAVADFSRALRFQAFLPEPERPSAAAQLDLLIGRELWKSVDRRRALTPREHERLRRAKDYALQALATDPGGPHAAAAQVLNEIIARSLGLPVLPMAEAPPRAPSAPGRSGP